MILIVGAMASELNTIYDQLEDLKKIDNEQLTLYMGKMNKVNLLILQTGVGKVNASMALSIVLSQFDISSIINVGIVGATKPYKPGEIVLVKQSTYHDFNVSVFGYDVGQVPKLPTYYFPTKALYEKVKALFKLNEAILYTGDAFTLKTNLTGIFDMEGNALAQVAYYFNKQILSIKIVSDIIGEKSQQTDYDLFESHCSIQIYDIIKQLISEVL